MKINKIQCGIVLLLCAFLFFGPFVSIALGYGSLDKITNIGRIRYSGAYTLKDPYEDFSLLGDAHEVIEWSFYSSADILVRATSINYKVVLATYSEQGEGIYRVREAGCWTIWFMRDISKYSPYKTYETIVIHYTVMFDGDYF